MGYEHELMESVVTFCLMFCLVRNISTLNLNSYDRYLSNAPALFTCAYNLNPYVADKFDSNIDIFQDENKNKRRIR